MSIPTTALFYSHRGDSRKAIPTTACSIGSPTHREISRFRIPTDIGPYKDELGEWHPPRLSGRYKASASPARGFPRTDGSVPWGGPAVSFGAREEFDGNPLQGWKGNQRTVPTFRGPTNECFCLGTPTSCWVFPSLPKIHTNKQALKHGFIPNCDWCFHLPPRPKRMVCQLFPKPGAGGLIFCDVCWGIWFSGSEQPRVHCTGKVPS